jgi:hypothetical protein
VRRIALALVLASSMGLFIASFGMHHCDEGHPLQQWLIPAACIAFAIACVRDRRRRLGLVAGLVLVSLALTLHYTALVHGPTYIGRSTPSWSMTETHPGRLPEQTWHTPLTGLYRR